MKLSTIACAGIALFALPLAGCNPIPSNCKDLARSILRHSFDDAPQNNGVSIKRVFIDPPAYSSPTRFHQYVISISNTGEISEEWWSHQGDGSGPMFKNPSITESPTIPEPQMKSSNGIVCNLGVHDSEYGGDWYGAPGGITSYSKSAALSQDSSGYSVKY